MSKNINHLLDEVEFRARLDTFELSARYLRAAVEATTGEKIAAPQLPADDIVAGVELLEAHCAALQNQLQNFQPRQPQAKGSHSPAVDSSSGAAVSLSDQSAKIAALTSERDALKAEVTKLTKERDDWKAKAGPVELQVSKQLATKLVEHGIRNPGIVHAVPGKKLTLTEKVLAAKGVSSLAELETANKPATK